MDLEDYISAERLKVYIDVLKLKPDEALGAYNWNKALTSAMQPLMHCLEVTLRNAIDHAVRHNPPPGAAGLWRTDANWIFDLPRYMGDKAYIRQGKRYQMDRQGNILHRQGKPVYAKTAWEEDCVRKVSKRIKDAGKALTNERVISGLDFGFWTNFLAPEYDEPRQRTLLWPHLTADVFSGAPVGTPRYVIERKFGGIRELRNRLAHHEAIWKFQYADPTTGKPDYSRPVYGLNPSLHLLQRAYDDMLEALMWLSRDRYAAFLTEGHHLRFKTLCTLEGLNCFTGREHIQEALNVRHSREMKLLLRSLRQRRTIKLTDKGQTVAIIGPDFIRT
ncbi:CAAX protease [Edaphovirga cremea]|uniref:CAAX protease n=1 Tax=Edaphovirga cremea TaxID=2267246 RepID=UPI003989D4D1